MNGPQPCTGQCGNGGFGYHRHVNNHTVAFSNALILHHGSDPIDTVEQVGIANMAGHSGNWAVMDKGNARAISGFDMAVDTIETRIHHAIDIPAIAGFIAFENFLRCGMPVQTPGFAGPKPLRIVEPVFILVLIAHYALPQSSLTLRRAVLQAMHGLFWQSASGIISAVGGTS